MDKIINNYDNMNITDKYDNCIYELTNIEKQILDFEKNMFNNWDFIEMNFNFRDKIDYYNYIISTPKYARMMNIKNMLEIESQKIYNLMNIDLD